MWVPYEGEPLETTIKQMIQTALLYNEGGNTLTDQAQYDCLYELMIKYGRIDTACRKWRFKTTTLKIWELYMKHFTKHLNYLDTHSTSEIQGYYGANDSKT